MSTTAVLNFCSKCGMSFALGVSYWHDGRQYHFACLPAIGGWTNPAPDASPIRSPTDSATMQIGETGGTETSEIAEALLFLAENERPSGGEQRFNSAHLYQLASEAKAAQSSLAAEKLKVAALERERDEALERVDELELDADRVSTEFEKECWVAMRGLLNLCHYDWRDVETDGIQADDAAEYIRITIDEIEKAEKRNLARAEAAEQRVAALVGALTTVHNWLANSAFDEADFPEALSIDDLVQITLAALTTEA